MAKLKIGLDYHLEHITDWSVIWHNFDVVYETQKKKREYLGYAVEKRENTLRELPRTLGRNQIARTVKFGLDKRTKRNAKVGDLDG